MTKELIEITARLDDQLPREVADVIIEYYNGQFITPIVCGIRIANFVGFKSDLEISRCIRRLKSMELRIEKHFTNVNDEQYTVQVALCNLMEFKKQNTPIPSYLRILAETMVDRNGLEKLCDRVCSTLGFTIENSTGPTFVIKLYGYNARYLKNKMFDVHGKQITNW